ncbi:uncharacterized protein LOC106011373, partial [Aplysia californica]|uniref:Glycosyltransferase family 92 protein n=1 Tax=Aplysia californica TaxID=6500 RepID=A0ABM0ZWY1_APLCA
MKVSYGSVNPEKAIEWMEYARMMNVTRVFTLTHDLDPPIKRVFEYYSKIGFLEMIPVNPAIKKGGKPRHFRPPRDSQQAWVDATMAAQDCKHRLAGFDYLFILDVDEFIVPQDAKQRSYLKILQASSKTHPEASGLIFDSHVVMLNWNTTRKSPLYITTHVNRTLVTNYDGNATNTRWAFRPKMVYFVQNNRIWPNRGTKIAYVDHSLYHLLHYRKCKMALWKGCLWAERTEEKNMLLVETPMIKRLRQLPLEEILPENMGYVEGLRNWKIPGA